MNEEEVIRKLRDDPAIFSEYVLDFKPFPYQIKFLKDKSKRIVVCAGRQVGKSAMTSARQIWYAIAHEKTTTLIVSATLRQSMLMFDKILSLAQRSKLVSRAVSYHTRTHLSFTNGSSIVALPCGRSGATLRGFSADAVVIDEAAFVPNDVISQVILPMVATTGGTAIMLSTPFDRDHIFYKAFTSSAWSKYQFPSSLNPMISSEFLQEHLDLNGQQKFAREFLAEFVDDEGAYFPMALLRENIHVCHGARG